MSEESELWGFCRGPQVCAQVFVDKAKTIVKYGRNKTTSNIVWKVNLSRCAWRVAPLYVSWLKPSIIWGLDKLKFKKATLSLLTSRHWNEIQNIHDVERVRPKKKHFLLTFSMVTKAIFLRRAKLCLLFNVCFTSAHVHGVQMAYREEMK